MKIIRYSLEMQATWDRFICNAKNSTFLLIRNYMDYHSDRFRDHSLFIYNDKNRLIAVFPAHEEEQKLMSHQGLTYGGIISDDTMTIPIMLNVFNELLTYAYDLKFKHLLYKTMPSIYCSLPAQEDQYALFRHNAHLYRRDVLSVIDQTQRLVFQERRQRKIKQALLEKLKVLRSLDYSSFWEILTKNLLENFGVTPVHSLSEIEYLARHFPDNIHLQLCYRENELLAGVVVYVTSQAVHIQYISASKNGKKNGALDLLFSELINVTYANKRFFDFGISTEQNGKYLNQGLIEQKEGFGARAFVHDYYEIKVV